LAGRAAKTTADNPVLVKLNDGGASYCIVEGSDHDPESPARHAESVAGREVISVGPGAEIVLSKEQAWKSLRGAGAVYPLIAGLEDERRRNREREDRP